MREKPSFDQVPNRVEEGILTLNPACALSRIMKKKVNAQNSEEHVCLDPDLACTFFLQNLIPSMTHQVDLSSRIFVMTY